MIQAILSTRAYRQVRSRPRNRAGRLAIRRSLAKVASARARRLQSRWSSPSSASLSSSCSLSSLESVKEGSASNEWILLFNTCLSSCCLFESFLCEVSSVNSGSTSDFRTLLNSDFACGRSSAVSIPHSLKFLSTIMYELCIPPMKPKVYSTRSIALPIPLASRTLFMPLIYF